MERLRAYYLERATSAPGRAAVSTEMFDAVLAARPASPLDFDARLRALSAFLDLPEAASLTAANKRIANILRKAPAEAAGAVDVEHLREEAEVRLFDAMLALRDVGRGRDRPSASTRRRSGGWRSCVPRWMRSSTRCW